MLPSTSNGGRRYPGPLLTGLIAVVVAAAFASGPAFAHTEGGKVVAHGQSEDVAGAFRSATLSLLAATNKLHRARSTQRAAALADLLALAQDRREQLAALITTDPREALRAALPANLRAAMPAKAGPFLEHDALEEGALAVYHVDALDLTASHYLYYLDTAEGRLSLHFAKDPPQLRSGAKVRIKALRLDDALLVESGTTSVTQASTMKSAALPNTLGAQRTLMIYVNFVDNPSQPYSMSTAQSMFTTMSDYWYEVSYQQTWLTGDVAGWFTVPVSSSTCDYTSLASYAKQAASNAGYVLSNYDHYVYVFPTWNACSWAGMGQVGGRPSEAWINPQAGLLLGSFAHEMGHNLGLYHAHALYCPGGVPIAASGCAKIEYGDGFDAMAAPQGTPHYNVFMKELLGWLGAGVSPPIITVPPQYGMASYTIAPLEVSRNTAPRVLKIPRTAACGSATDYLYVESRQALGFDSYISTLNAVPDGSTISPATNLQSGVLIHDALPGGPGTIGSLNSSVLLDMAPMTTGWAGPALDAGLSFTDPVSGLTIAPLSVSSSGTTVAVSYPAATCAHSAPSVAFTPTGTQYMAAGTTVTYAVSVTNNDTCACAGSTFDVAASVPGGWTASNPQTGIIAPGGSASASLAISSATSAAATFYSIPIEATSIVVPATASSITATIAITETPSAAPSVTLSPAGMRSATPGATISYTVTVTNNGSAATSFNISAGVPSGWTASNTKTPSVGAGASASVVLAIGAPGSASIGTYSIPVTASDTASSSTIASTNAAVSIVAASVGVSVASNQASYTRPTKRNQTVIAMITTRVTSGGVGLAAAPVTVRVKAPSAAATTLSGTTDGSGTATVSYAIKSKSATGVYGVTSSATYGTATGTATTSFSVQ